MKIYRRYSAVLFLSSVPEKKEFPVMQLHLPELGNAEL